MSEAKEHTEDTKTVRCAIYARKSSEEGLDQEFNSLDAQRQAGENFIASQKARGWVCLPEKYEDGGFSGGNMERPALKKLMQDVIAGHIDTVVVYKIDRLSRSLLDFAELIGAFEKHDVTFVSVTQQFNTTTSMGRLTLNILLSFAQFEREIIGERIRDKIAMQKKRGLQTGGTPVLGYDLVDSKLIVNEHEAELVRHVFKRFLELGSTTELARELKAQGVLSKAWTTRKGRVRKGCPINKSHIYRMLNNRKYLGEVTHKDQVYSGEHEAIIDRKTWNRVRAVLEKNWRGRGNDTKRSTPAMLKGIIRCGHCGCSMRPDWTSKKGRKYRYYSCIKLDKHPKEVCTVRRIAAATVENMVLGELRVMLRQPEVVCRVARMKAVQELGLSQQEVNAYLADLDAIWEYLFPAEQARLMKLLLDSVSVANGGVEIQVKHAGFCALVRELAGSSNNTRQRKAAS